MTCDLESPFSTKILEAYKFWNVRISFWKKKSLSLPFAYFLEGMVVLNMSINFLRPPLPQKDVYFLFLFLPRYLGGPLWLHQQTIWQKWHCMTFKPRYEKTIKILLVFPGTFVFKPWAAILKVWLTWCCHTWVIMWKDHTEIERDAWRAAAFQPQLSSPVKVFKSSRWGLGHSGPGICKLGPTGQIQPTNYFHK